MPSARADYFVSPTGVDTNPGTLEAPFKTIQHARDTVRTVNRRMMGDVHVYLRDGIYPVTKPIAFGPADSGFNGFKVIYSAYQKEVPIISGGVPVTGWTLDHDQVYKADFKHSTKLRLLFVNNVRATMASRKVKAAGPWGEFVIAGTEPWAETSGKTFDGVAFPSAEVPLLQNPEDVELLQRHTWCEGIVCARGMIQDGDHSVLQIQQPYGAIDASLAWGCGMDPKGSFTVRNAYEFMSQPGDFYFNKKTQTLYYFSRGEDLAKVPVVAPISDGLLRIIGSSTTKRVKNLVFQGLTFSYDQWQLKKVGDSHGFAAVQSLGIYTRYTKGGSQHVDHYDCLDLPQATVELENCDSILFERNRFEHLGSGCSISLTNDVVNSTVSGNVFNDLSGNAVNTGHPQHYIIGDGPIFPEGVEGVCADDVVKDNLIRHCSLDFIQEEGLSGFFTQHLQELHNDVYGTPYGGLALGWWWGDAKIPPSTVPRDNVVGYNRIVQTNQLLPGDGGPLYVLGQQPGGEIKNNYVHWISRLIYCDDGSAYWKITNNVLEGGDPWINLWTNRIHDLTIDGNYTNKAGLNNHGTHCPVTNTHLEQAPPWSPEAKAIIDASGLEPAYQDLLATLPKP